MIVESIVLVLFSAFVIIFSSFILKRGNDDSLPPGNLGLPLVGETLDFLRCLNNKPWDFFLKREAKYGKVYKTSLFGSPVVVVSPPVGTKLMFTTYNTVVGKLWPLPIRKLLPENALLHMDEHDSKSFRQIFLGFLASDTLRRHVASTSMIVQKHLDKHWRGKQVVRAHQLIKRCFFSFVCNMFLSLIDEDEIVELMEHFETLTHGFFCIPVDLPWTTFHKSMCARKKIFQILEKHIVKRRIQLHENEASSFHDLLSVLLTTKSEEGRFMVNDAIKDTILGFLVAGHETTASLFSMTMRCLAENPTCLNEMKRVHCEIESSRHAEEPLNWEDLKKMKYSWRVFQETLRVRPAAPAIFRKALMDFEIEGFKIPKGWQLFSTGYSSHMKEEYFPDPDKFDPARFEGSGSLSYTYFPFGGGPRMCPGIELAKMQNLVFIHYIVTRYNWTLVDPDEPIKLLPVATPAYDLPLNLI